MWFTAHQFIFFPVNGDTILLKESSIILSFQGKNAQNSIICVYCKLKVDEKFKKFYQKDPSEMILTEDFNKRTAFL